MTVGAEPVQPDDGGGRRGRRFHLERFEQFGCRHGPMLPQGEGVASANMMAAPGTASDMPSPAHRVSRRGGSGPSILRVAIGNARGEPGSAQVADEEHRARAVGRGRRRQDIVDPEVAVGLERNAAGVRVVERERGGGFTDQRGEHALVGIGPDAVASGQQQTPSVDLDASVDLHPRLEIGDGPDLTGRIDRPHRVAVHVRKRPGGAHISRRARDGNDADPSFELHEGVAGHGRDRGHGSEEQRDNQEFLHDGDSSRTAVQLWLPAMHAVDRTLGR